MGSGRSSDETAREEPPSARADGDAPVRRVALGATNAATILLALGAVWLLYSILYVRTTAPGTDPGYFGANWLPHPWQMPQALWSIPLALGGLALLVGGVRLQRPRESARRVVDLSAWSLIAAASAGIGELLSLSILMGIEGGIEGVILGLTSCCMHGVPFWLTIIYAWHLRTSLRRADVVLACGGQVDQDGPRTKQRRLSENLLAIALGMVVAMIAVGVYWSE